MLAQVKVHVQVARPDKKDFKLRDDPVYWETILVVVQLSSERARRGALFFADSSGQSAAALLYSPRQPLPPAGHLFFSTRKLSGGCSYPNTQLCIPHVLLGTDRVAMYLPHVKAVMFDIGGVVLRSPFIAIADYETEKGLPPDYLNVSIASRGASGAWQRFERGELPLFDFYAAFGRDLSDATNGNIWYTEYCERKRIVCPKLPEEIQVDGRDLFGRMMRSASTYDPHMLTAIRNLRAAGKWRVLALTNNFGAHLHTGASPSQEIPDAELRFLRWQDGPIPKHLRELFDRLYDSSEVGLRKPDPQFFLHACKDSGIDPEQIIFLDDIGMNLKTAKQLGMTTIHVPIGGSLRAVKQLEEYLGIDLCTDITKDYPGRPKL